MATSKLLPLWLVLAASCAWSREAALPANCAAAGSQPPIAGAKQALATNAGDLPARFKLADAWSDAGCFADALQVLQAGQMQNSRSNELEARIRVAQSVISEQTYFDKLDQAHQEAKVSRAVFRCTKLAELASCDDALNLKPNDPALLAARDALRGAPSASPHIALENLSQPSAAHDSGTRPPLRIAQQAARKQRQSVKQSTPKSQPVPILEERHEAVVANTDLHYSNDAPATRSN